MQGSEACIALTPAPVIPGERSFPTPKARPHSLPESPIFSLDQELPMARRAVERSLGWGGEEVEVTCWGSYEAVGQEGLGV